MTANERHLFTPDDAFRGSLGPATIHYLLPEAPKGDVTIDILDGGYSVRISSGGWNDTRAFQIQPDPRVATSGEDYREHLSLAQRVGARTKELYDNLAALREIKAQASEIGGRMREAGHGDDVADAATALSDKLTAIESNLTQLEG